MSKRQEHDAVQLHVMRHGWRCPGYGKVPGHQSYELTFDENENETTGYPILCKGCRSKRNCKCR